MYQDYKDLLSAFQSHGVRYLIVGGYAVIFHAQPRGFDILPDLPGIDFDAAWESRVEEVIDTASGLKANFISREDLIAAKLAAGRPQDLADVVAIRDAVESRGTEKLPKP
jgi:hypothetical protein